MKFLTEFDANGIPKYITKLESSTDEEAHAVWGEYLEALRTYTNSTIDAKFVADMRAIWLLNELRSK